MIARFFTSGGRGLGILLTYVPLYLHNQLHYSSITTSILFTVLAAGSVVSPILGGKIADRIGRRIPVIICSLLLSAASTGFLILSGHYLIGVATALLCLGLVVFNEGPLSQTLLSDRASDLERDGAFSMYFVMSYGGGAMWGLLIGLIISYVNFTSAFEVMILSYILASFVYLLVREARGPREKLIPNAAKPV